MFGLARFFLALIVVKAHVWPTDDAFVAWQAVFSFYTLSGFLMCLVLNRTYGFSSRGVGAFALNRFLRLYPTYYLVQVLAVAYILAIGPLNQFYPAIVLPRNAREFFSSLLILGQVGFDNSQLSPQRLAHTSWSLSVEIFSYLLLALGFGRGLKSLAMFFLLGVVMLFGLHGAFMVEGHDYGPHAFQNHYGVLQAGFVPFALGGFAYHLRDHDLFRPARLKIGFILGLFAANAALSFALPFHRYVSAFFVASLLAFFLIPMLFQLVASKGWARVDDFLGRLSYPIFIVHMTLVSLIWRLTGILPHTLAMFLAVCAGALAFSLAAIYIDARIEKVRSMVKSASAGVARAPAASSL